MTPMRFTSISIVLPCYNEQESIRPFLERLIRNWETLREGLGVEKIEVIVVDDASTDSSLNNLSDFDIWIKVVRHTQRLGYGAAIKTGILAAKGSLIAFCDLDATYEPLDLIQMKEVLQNSSMRMVIGNRLHNLENMPISRSVGNLFFRSTIKILFGRQVMDSCSGLRIFRAQDKDFFCFGLPDQLNYSLAMTLKLIRTKNIFLEVPISYYRRLGHSKLKIFKDGIDFFLTILFYRIFPMSSALSQAAIITNEAQSE
jgi:glycosyltransferase involved in cell wall biosynthesis